MKHIQKSPIKNADLTPYLTCMDHTVSHETFSILEDVQSSLLVTSPRPQDEELSKYYESDSYISHTNSNKTLTDKLYQFVKNYAIKNKVKLINSFKCNEKSILDIGTGTGDFLSACKKSKWQIYGVEPNAKARKAAETKAQIKIASNIDVLSNRKFDVITMWHVLEHIPNLLEYLETLNSLLKPTGTLIIAVPNYKSYDARYYKEFWAAYDVPRHLWHFSRESIHKLFKEQQMNVVKVIPMYYDAFYVSLLSEKYRYGKNRLFKAFLIAAISNLKAIKTKEYSSLIYVIQKRKSHFKTI